MVGIGVPRGVVQPGGDAAVAGLRGLPGLAGAAELPQAQLRPLPRRFGRILRAPLGRRRAQPPLVLPAGSIASPGLPDHEVLCDLINLLI